MYSLLHWALISHCQIIVYQFTDSISDSTRHFPNEVSMLGQRRRRWTSIETTLGECLVFSGMPAPQSTDVEPVPVQCRASVASGGPTMQQRRFNGSLP